MGMAYERPELPAALPSGGALTAALRGREMRGSRPMVLAAGLARIREALAVGEALREIEEAQTPFHARGQNATGHPGPALQTSTPPPIQRWRVQGGSLQ